MDPKHKKYKENYTNIHSQILKNSDKDKILKVLKEQRHVINQGTKTRMTADLLGNSSSKKAVKPHLYCRNEKIS